MITLTMKEQALGLTMLNNEIRFNNQKIYISHTFFKTMCKFRKLKLIETRKVGRGVYYKLSLTGKLIFSLIADFKGNEEFKRNALKGEINIFI